MLSPEFIVQVSFLWHLDIYRTNKGLNFIAIFTKYEAVLQKMEDPHF